MKKTTFTESLCRVSSLTNGSFKRFMTLLILPFMLVAFGQFEANAQCTAPVALGATSIGTTSATLNWTTTNPPATNHQWVVTIGGVGLLVDGSNCPSGGQAVIVMTVTPLSPGYSRVGNVISYVANGLPPGTSLEFYVSEQCTGIAPPNNVSTCAGPGAFATFDTPIVVTPTSVVSPACPFGTANYTANGSITINVANGSCVGTYTVNATPVIGSGPQGSTPPNTTVTTYIGFPQGNFFFGNAGAGCYTITVTETGACNLQVDPTVIVVCVPDGIDAVAPTFYVTDFIGNILIDNDPLTLAPTSINFGNVVIPDGSCSWQQIYFAYGFDDCDGFINAVNAVSANAVTIPPTINPPTQVAVIPDGFGFYQIDVNWSVGQTTLSIFGSDSSGNTANAPFGLQLIANVLDNTAPVVTIIGNTNVPLAACQTSASAIYSFQIDDLCDQDVIFANLVPTFGAATGFLNFTGNNYVEYLVNFPAAGTYILSATYTDFFGNIGFFDIQVNVVATNVDAPPIIYASPAQWTIPFCETTVDLIYGFTIVDDCAPIDISQVQFNGGGSGLPNLNGAGFFFVDAVGCGNLPCNAVYFEVRGNVGPGNFFPQISYQGITALPSIQVNFAVPNVPPVSLACVGNVNTSLNNDCEVVITPSMLLNGSFGCLDADDFVIQINGVVTNTISTCGTYTYMVTLAPGVVAPFTPCWGNLVVEDKRTLFLSCGRDTLECFEALEIGFLGDVSQMCDGCQDVNNVLIDETIRPANCLNPAEVNFTSLIQRTWRLTDIFGNISQCIDTIWVRRPSANMAHYQMPADVQLACTATPAQYHPSVTGYPTYTAGGTPIVLDPTNAALVCNLLIKFDDMELTGGCGGTREIMRLWTITELYCGALVPKIVGSQMISLVDNVAPVINCAPAAQTVWTNPFSCSSDLFIARPSVSDNCTASNAIRVTLTVNGVGFYDNFQGGTVTGFEAGPNTITFRAYDACGNSSSCTRVITVVDEIAPIAVCQSFTTVSLGIDGTARVYTSSFNDGSYDNCGIDSIRVRRMTPSQSCDPVPVFRDYVPVCCEDTGEPVIVIMRVWDSSGNTNECMVSLEVQDKIPATISCLPNLTVNCGFDLDNLSVFGKIANINNGETRDSVFIGGIFRFLDGFAYDNCDLRVVELAPLRNLNSCGAGYIERYFEARAVSGNLTIARCTQRITVINDVNYLPASIVWPCDLTLTNFCVTNPGLELTPDVLVQFNGTGVSCHVGIPSFYDRPRFLDDECTQVGITYKDHVFEIQDSACYKILREWKIIDWCAYEGGSLGSNIESYIYRDVQIIKIMNNIAPEITCPANVNICSFQEVCSTGEFLTLTATATDDCTAESDLRWTWQLFANVANPETFIPASTTPTVVGAGATVARNFPVGTHVLRYVVEDKCGNTDACTTIVRVRDCKKPTPICFFGLSVDLMPSNGQVTVPATRWNNNSFDNCTANANLIIRVERLTSGDGINPPGPSAANILFTCADLGSVPVRMWVGDADGNWDYCETFMVVQNNMGADCPPVTGGGIEGLVYTESTEKVEKVEVKLTGGANNFWMTGDGGNFQFNSLLFGSDFEVTPKRNDMHENGITTYDLMMIQRHILGSDKLDSPYKIIGADINNDKRLSAADLVELRKLILASITEFSNNTSWRFVDEKYSFDDPSNPLNENFTETINITNFYGNVPMLKFIAIKVGDMNGSVKANSTNLNGNVSGRNSQSLVFDVMDAQLAAGKEYTVDFRSSDFQQIAGYQFTFKFNPATLSLKDIKPGVLRVNDSNFGLTRLEEGVITTSWNETEAISHGADDVLFSLTFKVNQAAQLSDILSINSAYTKAEAYSEGNTQVMGVNLNFQNAASGVAGNGFELFQNRPNPFNANTTIGFNLPEAGNATITIYDMTGKVIRVIDNDFARGYNEVQVNASELGTTPGVLYYELKTTYATATKKMVLLK